MHASGYGRTKQLGDGGRLCRIVTRKVANDRIGFDATDLAAGSGSIATCGGEDGLGALAKLFDGNRRAALAERTGEGVHVVQGFKDESVPFDRLAECHAGLEVEGPHSRGGEGGLERGRNGRLGGDEPVAKPFPFDGRHNQKKGGAVSFVQ